MAWTAPPSPSQERSSPGYGTKPLIGNQTIETAGQRIRSERVSASGLAYSVAVEDGNRRGVWSASGIHGEQSASYTALVDVRKTVYHIPDGVQMARRMPREVMRYLAPSETIQSDHELIRAAARRFS